MRFPWPLAVLLFAGCAPTLQRFPLQRVILYQNGIGYFERTGRALGARVVLPFARHEVDDAMKTLTVLDRAGSAVATLEIPRVDERSDRVPLGVRFAAEGAHDLRVAYAVPTPIWKATYRLVLDDKQSLLQAWAKIDNASQEDWRDVQLTLATGAPISYAIDLHSTTFVDRPDLAGNLIPPVVTGRVGTERATAAASAAARAADRTVDTDGDRIPDRDDKCPNDPETYNGIDDEDGCPDRGRVIVTEAKIEILDNLYFKPGSAALASASQPIVDALAATLLGNPSIKVIEIQGHADAAEGDGQALSERRAATVQAALLQKGVSSLRLQTRGYGATQPTDSAKTEAARAKNRRVAFVILRREDNDADGSTKWTPRPPTLDARSVATSARPMTQANEVAGATRYDFKTPVTVLRGQSAMVAILNQPIVAEDAYLWRPDAHAPGSDRHPFRVVRLQNKTGFTLQPGPIAIFARGTFVGDSVLDALDLDATAWVPYALDGSTTVTLQSTNAEQPIRLVSINRGVVTVENAGVRKTTYAIAAGRQSAARIYLRHDKTRGYTATNLPTDTIDRGDSYLVPATLTAAKETMLTIEEREPRRRRLELVDGRAEELAVYVEGAAHLPAPVAAKLKDAVKLRREMASLEEEVMALRRALDDLASRSTEVRESLKTLEKIKSAGDLKQKLLAKLTTATNEADKLTKDLAAKSETLATVRSRLRDLISELELNETTGG